MRYKKSQKKLDYANEIKKKLCYTSEKQDLTTLIEVR